jgi:hypothetical protein
MQLFETCEDQTAREVILAAAGECEEVVRLLSRIKRGIDEKAKTKGT